MNWERMWQRLQDDLRWQQGQGNQPVPPGTILTLMGYIYDNEDASDQIAAYITQAVHPEVKTG